MLIRLITCCALLFAGTIHAENSAECPPKPAAKQGESGPSLWEQVSSVDYVGGAKNSWQYFQERIWPVMEGYMLFLDTVPPDVVKIVLYISVFNTVPSFFTHGTLSVGARGVILAATAAHLRRLIKTLTTDRQVELRTRHAS